MKPIFLKIPTQNRERFSLSSLKHFTVTFDKVKSFWVYLNSINTYIELALNSKSSQQTLNYPHKDLSEFVDTINYSSSG